MAGRLSERVFQAIAEAKIQEAMKAGEFNNLPGFGKPFEFDITEYDPNWWIRKKLEKEQLKQSLPAFTLVPFNQSTLKAD